MELLLSDVIDLTGGRLGVFDFACPECGPGRQTPRNRTRKVLRIWRTSPDFAAYSCIRCGLKGYVRPEGAMTAIPESQAIRAEITARDVEYAAKRLAIARKLAARMQKLAGTVAETYLREMRGIRAPIPPTLGFLPAYRDFPPAMLALFGFPDEIEPGVLQLPTDRVVGVEMTHLKAESSGEVEKLSRGSIGNHKGSPIVLAPMNDQLGLIICEGVETGLSWFEATGLGVWVAGGAPFMPALADKVPNHTVCVHIDNEGDIAAEAAVPELARKLKARGIHVEIIKSATNSAKAM